ncbi:PP2C family protein-serine/threonine phosphatase [Solwaraspora sp. WMMD792]|uniref:PP2C family protein-serine/threonine phosphatase n=1 Tax=Solwaraspora sp. WMMD792 TaxID=3016099 RepID=UPI0024170AAB|nr:PP2C family protein-serine/threonine phosphatase [Solwaraspora sp. WMMD792]MDG4770976.1 PP2C family protein-serine/threonine phosphatase [Solwaraspora sp. WMMD792]
MERTPERQWLDALSDVLLRSHLFQPDELGGAFADVMATLGVHATIYLADEEQHTLRPVPVPGRPDPQPQPVEGSVAGRAFTLVESIPALNAPAWWIPMVDGTDRLGVIEYVFDDPADADGPHTRRRCETVAGLVGHLITVTRPKGDHLRLVGRSRPATVAGELLSQVLPPLTAATGRITVSAVLEPCYDVGGDGFDYAIDGDHAFLAIFDAVGHSLKAGLACTTVIAAVRSARRCGHDLVTQGRTADAALTDQFTDARFVTAFLADLDLETGLLRYVNAGHPRPLLLRGGKMVRELRAGRRLPLGIPDTAARVGEEILEPGDQLLLFTDGVPEAGSRAGDPFGLPRLVDFAERQAATGLPAPEAVRRLARAVAEHRGGPPDDDATLLLAEWSRTAAVRVLPTPL